MAVIKRTVALLVCVAMLFAFASCNDESADRGNNSSDPQSSAETSSVEDEGMTATDVYDLYNEAIIDLAEESAYDMSVYADVELGDGSVMTVEMEYRKKETDGDAVVYSFLNVGGLIKKSTYYANGIMHTVNEGILYGSAPVVAEEPITYEEFNENNVGLASMLIGIDIPFESFENADVEEKESSVTIAFTFSDITELPEFMLAYTSLFGFDPTTATDVVYDDAVITFDITEDGKLEQMNAEFGASYTTKDGVDSEFSIDADISINATGDDVVVEEYTAE